MEAAGRTIDDYDEVPYNGRAVPGSHPSRLAMLARLCGLQPPPPTGCRVLELGCAVGTNLLPMAEGLPGSRFVGVDLSARQIERARETAARAALDNVELRHLDILDVDDRLGEFDYIVCHGVYSWVRPQVQAHILEVGRRLLAPAGLMYVSYNANPGWRLRAAVRDMMRYHVAGATSAREKIEQARELIRFLAGSARPLRASYRQLLEEELAAVDAATDHYLFHDQLEESNEPLYLHQFVERAGAAGLAYLADADLPSMFAHAFDAPTAARLQRMPPLRREQYMDFLRGRMFRASVLHRPEVRPDMRLDARRLLPLQVRLEAPLEATGTREQATVWTHADRSITTGPVMTAIVRRLRQEWPNWVAVRSLVDAAGEAGAAEAGRGLDELLGALTHGVILAADSPPPLAARAGEAPCCAQLVRAMAAQDEWVVNRQHQSVRLDPMSRFLACRLDGSVRRAGLAREIGHAVARGEVRVVRGERPAERLDERACAEIVEHRLALLARSALLLA